jgi:sugar lactone lactonase YvrE
MKQTPIWFPGTMHLAALMLCGCIPTQPASHPDLVWGQRGHAPGRFDRPRAAVIDDRDLLYIVDKTGRIQVFDAEGKFQRVWSTPETENGLPCGLAIDRDGNLLVADTHYFRVLTYTSEGQLLPDKTIGGEQGQGPGQFNFVTDVAVDSRGDYYVAEYGQCDRVQKISRSGRFVLQWGGHGSEPGQFIQPRCLLMDGNDHLWVADACNHRIQEFDVSSEPPRLVQFWGTQGTQRGELRYPYGLAFDGEGGICVCEFGNSRVQKFTLAGQFLAEWGRPGRGPGELNQPWSVARDSRGRYHVLDTYNHRVQRFRL